jgi:hypothetical protein
MIATEDAKPFEFEKLLDEDFLSEINAMQSKINAALERRYGKNISTKNPTDRVFLRNVDSNESIEGKVTFLEQSAGGPVAHVIDLSLDAKGRQFLTETRNGVLIHSVRVGADGGYVESYTIGEDRYIHYVNLSESNSQENSTPKNGWELQGMVSDPPSEDDLREVMSLCKDSRVYQVEAKENITISDLLKSYV